MSAHFEHTLTRPEDEQAQLTAAVERFGRDRLLPAPVRYRLSLIIDELVSNCIAHGTRPGQDRTIHVRVTDGADALSVEIIDSGPPFDPSTYPISRCPEHGPAAIGGMGLCLVRKIVSGIEYSRLDSSNHVRLTLAKNIQEPECNSRK